MKTADADSKICPIQSGPTRGVEGCAPEFYTAICNGDKCALWLDDTPWVQATGIPQGEPIGHCGLMQITAYNTGE